MAPTTTDQVVIAVIGLFSAITTTGMTVFCVWIRFIFKDLRERIQALEKEVKDCTEERLKEARAMLSVQNKLKKLTERLELGDA